MYCTYALLQVLCFLSFRLIRLLRILELLSAGSVLCSVSAVLSAVCYDAWELPLLSGPRYTHELNRIQFTFSSSAPSKTSIDRLAKWVGPVSVQHLHPRHQKPPCFRHRWMNFLEIHRTMGSWNVLPSWCFWCWGNIHGNLILIQSMFEWQHSPMDHNKTRWAALDRKNSPVATVECILRRRCNW